MTGDAQKGGHEGPRVSVIVTNHNYVAYLDPCLDSLRAQTSPPDEIIVVDDGSTDGSRAYLARQEGLTVLLQDNGGQAAAFNAGFAVATGEAVIFLDADDVLYPDAIAVIRALWADGVAGFSWGLDTIDAQGHKTGRYEMSVPDLDLRPRLLHELVMLFMPTSGNVFSRESIGWAFPLPAENWRICADALLVRVAVLSGVVLPLSQVLGGYRVHGANNYHREILLQWSKDRHAFEHIAEAALDLVGLTRRAGRYGGPEAEARLLAGALRIRLRAENIAPDPAGFDRFLHRFVAAAQGGGARLTTLARLVAWLVRASERARSWAREPATRPRAAQWVLEAIAGRTLAVGRYGSVPRRFPFDGAPAEPGTLGDLPLQDLLDTPEWDRDWVNHSFTLRAPLGRVTLSRLPGVASEATFALAPIGSEEPTVTLTCNGLPLGSHHLTGPQSITAILPPAPPGAWQPDRIEIAFADAPAGLVHRLRRRTGRLILTGLSLADIPETGPDAVLPVQGEASLAALGPVLRSATGAVLDGESLLGPGERIGLALPHLPPPYALTLRFSPEQAPGSLFVAAEGRMLFSGRVGPSSCISVPIPADFAALHRIDLAPGFRPDAFLDGADLALDTLGWSPGAETGPVLFPGERVGAGTGRALEPFLGTGWQFDGDGPAVLSGPMADLRLILPGSETAVLLLDVEPLDPFAADAPPLFVVTTDGQEAARVRLGGRATVEIALGAGAPVEIALHGAGIGEGDLPDRDHGGIVLHAITLAPMPDPVPPGRTLPKPTPAPDLARHLTALHDAAARGFAGTDLAALRGRIARALADAAPKALWSLVKPDDLLRLSDLGLRLGDGGAPVPEAGGDGGDWLQRVALSALAGPSDPRLARATLDAVPHLTAPFARAAAAILVRDPGPGAPEDVLRAHQSTLVARLTEARRILATAPLDSARFAIARDLVRAVRPHGLLFSALDLKPHVTAFARALETLLLRQGHTLDLPPRARTAAARTRIGIVLRHAGAMPETWIARGLISALPPGRAEITVFLTEPQEGPPEDLAPARVVSLAGRGTADTVTAIRAADLHIAILGAAFHGFMPAAEIAAHRLAPRQIAFAATHPATTGFRSVDEMILGELQSPPEARADCAETAVVAPDTGLRFDLPATGALPKPFVDWARDFLLGAVPEDGWRYVFHHIPKTGGTSLRKVLSEWFDVVGDYPAPWTADWSLRADLSQLGSQKMLSGHFWAHEMPLFKRYPELHEEADCRVFSLLRDPLDRAVSNFHFELSSRKIFDPGFAPSTLDAYLAKTQNYYLQNFAATETTWPEVLDRYWFIGTLERFRDCVDYLADAMGKPRPDALPVENATERREGPSPEAVAAFKANNATDYAIYEEVNRRLDRLLGTP